MLHANKKHKHRSNPKNHQVGLFKKNWVFLDSDFTYYLIFISVTHHNCGNTTEQSSNLWTVQFDFPMTKSELTFGFSLTGSRQI